MYIKELKYHFYDCFKEGRPKENDFLIYNYYKWKGDKRYVDKYRNILMLKYHGLIFGFMRKFKTIDTDEFYFRAVDKLILAIDRYDTERGIAFSGYYYRILINEVSRLRNIRVMCELPISLPDKKNGVTERADANLILDSLKPDQRKLLKEYFGIDGKRWTLRELGKRECITHEGVRQRINTILKQIRKQYDRVRTQNL